MFVLFKQKTSYEMRISDWSSDVCSSDLSGCGKSVSALSILRLVADPPGRVVGGSIKFMGKDLLKLSDEEIRHVRGKDIAMVFQEPMTSPNTVLTNGRQLTETLETHLVMSRAGGTARALAHTGLVGIY